MKKLYYSILSVIMIAIAIMTIFLFIPARIVKAESLSQDSATILVGQKINLDLIDADPAKNIKWKSSNKKIASVNSEGIVTGKKKGKAVITAKVGKNSYKCKVIVQIGIEKEKIFLKVGEEETLKLCGTKIRSAKSDAPDVATVNKKGKVTAVSEGSALITLEGKNKKSYYCLVVVSNEQLYTISFETNGGSFVESQKVAAGGKAEKPTDPTLSGKTFEGWYTDSSLKNAYDFSTPVTKDITLYAKWTTSGSKSLGILSADKMGILAGTNSQIEFYILSTEKLSGIELYKDNVKVGNMNEENLYNEYRYAATVTVSPSSSGQVFVARSSGYKDSSEIVIYTFDTPTAAEYQKTENAIKALQSISDQYIKNGYIAPEKYQESIDAVYKKAMLQKNEGDVLQVIKGSHSVDIQFSTGIWYIYEPFMEDTKALGVTGDVSVVTSQPYNSDGLYDPQTDIDASIIDNSADYIYFTTNKDDGDVDFNFVNTFGENQIILWDGHGGYSNTFGPYIITGITNFQFSNLVTGEVLISPDNRLAFTSSYVLNKLGNMSGSILFLSTCESVLDDRLAAAFISKGAELVVGFDRTVSVEFGRDTMKEFSNQIAIKDSTGQFRTMDEIFRDTTGITGITDPYYDTSWGDRAANMLAYGNGEFTLNQQEGEENVRITFDVNGGSGTNSAMDVPVGYVLEEKAVSIISKPSKNGYEFDGWYLDRESKVKCTYPMTINNDMTFYAGWKLKEEDNPGTIPAGYTQISLGEVISYVDPTPEDNEDKMKNYAFITGTAGVYSINFISSGLGASCKLLSGS